MKSFLKYNLPSLLWAAVIFYACFAPSSGLPKIKIPNLDKLVHFTLYFILTGLMILGWKKQTTFTSLHRKSLLKVLLIACAYGLAIEIMQEAFTSDRHFDWLDELANATGAGVGGLLAVKLFK